MLEKRIAELREKARTLWEEIFALEEQLKQQQKDAIIQNKLLAPVVWTARVQGTALYLYSDRQYIPRAVMEIFGDDMYHSSEELLPDIYLVLSDNDVYLRAEIDNAAVFEGLQQLGITLPVINTDDIMVKAYELKQEYMALEKAKAYLDTL